MQAEESQGNQTSNDNQAADDSNVVSIALKNNQPQDPESQQPREDSPKS